jgi:hypothetical protein
VCCLCAVQSAGTLSVTVNRGMRGGSMETSDIVKRIDELLAAPSTTITLQEIPHGTVSLLSLVYGEKSPQLTAHTKEIGEIRAHPSLVLHSCHGALHSMKREIESGLTGNLRQQITGEVLTDLIQLSRTVLSEQGDKAKNVSAVLAAAAFEDAIRRMGKTLAGVPGEDDLSEVLKKLKDTGVMQGPQVGIAQSYLSFRNHALHANWDKIEKESIHSVLGFVEQLLLKHFS